jgi:deazaflavin-dependent oxidoreductase (nitroreductase family)
MPGWYHNLRAHPHAEIQVGRRRFQVDAEIAPTGEYEQLWAAWLGEHPAYARAQQQTTRRFPLVRLIARDDS